MTQARRSNIDLVRWAVMMSIFIIHSMGGRSGINWLGFAMICFSWVGTFFIISGALMLPVGPDVGRWVKKRLTKVVPPFIVWTVVYFLYYALTEHWTPAYIWERAYSVVFVSVWPAGWFVMAIIGLYIFAPVISAWLQTASRRAVEWYLGIWLASGIMPYAQLWAPVDWVGGTIFGQFYGLMGYMVAGYYLTRWPWTAWPRRMQAWVWAGLLFFAAAFGWKIVDFGFRNHVQDYMYYDTAINIQCLNLIVFMTFSTMCPRGWWARFLAWSAERTYGLYLVSWLVLSTVATWLSSMVETKWISFAVNLSLSIGISYLIVGVVGLLPRPIRRLII